MALQDRENLAKAAFGSPSLGRNLKYNVVAICICGPGRRFRGDADPYDTSPSIIELNTVSHVFTCHVALFRSNWVLQE